MNKLIPMILLSLTACQPIDDTVSDTDDVIEVNDIYWSSYGNVEPYPFTTQYGHIACSLDEVTYYPNDTINDESQVGLPLNKLAQQRQDDSNIEPTVKNAIKPNADLSEAIRMGLDRCKQVQQRLDKLRSESGM
jgi:hypothetical protein